MKKNTKKILVTGSSGFVGQNLILKLSKKFTKYKIYSLYHKNIQNFKSPKNVQLIKVNLLKVDELKKIPNDFDFLIHLAGNPQTFLDKKEGQSQIINNVTMTYNIINKLIESQCKKMIFLSSVYVYSGSNKNIYNEKINVFPKEPLGISKFYCEKILSEFCESFQIKCICFRAFTIYGKGSRKKQFITSTINKFKSKNNFLKFGNPKIKRDFIHVQDVVSAIIKSLSKFNKIDTNFFTLNLATGKSVDIKKTIKIISKLLNIDKNYIFNTFKDNKHGDCNHKANINKIKKFLKWKPKINLENGLKIMVNQK